MISSLLDKIDLDYKNSPEGFPSNLSKWILWQDPIYNHFEVQYKDINLENHFDTVYILN